MIRTCAIAFALAAVTPVAAQYRMPANLVDRCVEASINKSLENPANHENEEGWRLYGRKFKQHSDPCREKNGGMSANLYVGGAQVILNPNADVPRFVATPFSVPK